MMGERPVKRQSIFWICVLALFTSALAFSIRTGTSGAIKAAMLDKAMAAHSGELIAAALGNSFLGFAVSLIIVAPLLDLIGAKRVLLFASACYIIGPAIIIWSPSSGGVETAYQWLTVGMVVSGLAWGCSEATINPLVSVLFPEEKAGRLNALHAWWPAGIVLGGFASILFFDRLALGWQALMALIMIPGAAMGVLALFHSFPKTESSVLGVSFGEMIAEPFKHPRFWIFPAIMFLTASAELAPGSWVDIALTQTAGMPGILVLVYVSALMFVGRHFAGPLEHRLSDIGLLFLCTVPAALGLFGLGIARTPTTALIAATFWAIGVCFMWPTMLAAVARRWPRGGPWSIGIVAFAGAMAIYFVLPEIGKVYDQAKIEKAGGAEALAALPPGPELQAVLTAAAERSFETIAIIPAILFFIFGALYLWERRHRRVVP